VGSGIFWSFLQFPALPVWQGCVTARVFGIDFPADSHVWALRSGYGNQSSGTSHHHGPPLSSSSALTLQVLAQDLLNPLPSTEAKKHKLKKLVQAPNSFFMVSSHLCSEEGSLF
jgi:hypothetical protein